MNWFDRPTRSDLAKDISRTFDSATAAPSELEKAQYDYAWKWFCFHADQRVKMFNFMLIVFGIFAAGVVNALDKKVPNVAIAGLCYTAAVLAILFVRLDNRNRYLVWLGEDVLVQMERFSFFGEKAEIQGRFGGKVPFGILWRQAREEEALQPDWLTEGWRGKHRVILPLMGYLIAITFTAIGTLVMYYRN